MLYVHCLSCYFCRFILYLLLYVAQASTMLNISDKAASSQHCSTNCEFVHSTTLQRNLFKTSLDKMDPQHGDLLPHNRARMSERRRVVYRFREGLHQMGLQLKDVKIIHYWRMRNNYSFVLNLSTETK